MTMSNESPDYDSRTPELDEDTIDPCRWFDPQRILATAKPVVGDATTCDRCAQAADSDKVSVIQYWGHVMASDERWQFAGPTAHLCESCSSEVREWLEEREEQGALAEKLS